MTITAGFSFSDIVARANDAVFVAEVDGDQSSSSTIVYVNDAFCRLSGYRESEAVGQVSSFQDGEGTNDETRDKIRDALQAGRHIRTRLLQYAKDGTAYWVDINIMPLFGDDGQMTHFAAIERDVTADVEREEELLSLATTDDLTGARNRRHFMERAELEAFADACEGGSAYPLTPAEAVHGTAVLEAVIRSADSRAPVLLKNV